MKSVKVLKDYKGYPNLHERLDMVEELMLQKVPNAKAVPFYLDWCAASGSDDKTGEPLKGSRTLFEDDKDRVFRRNHLRKLNKKDRDEMSKRSWVLNELDYNQYRNYINGQSSANLGNIRTSAEIEKLLDDAKDKDIVINFTFGVPETKTHPDSIKGLIKKKK